MTEEHPVSWSGWQPGPLPNPSHPSDPFDPADPFNRAPTTQPGGAFPGPRPSGQPPVPQPPVPQPPVPQPPVPQPPVPQPPVPQPPVQQRYGPLGPPAWRDPLPASGTEYHQFLQTPRNAWWKGLVAIVAFVAGYLLLTTAVTVAAMLLDVAAGRSTWEAYASGKIEFTPAIFLATNLGNALSIPLAMLLQWLIWGQPVRWLHSVTGTVRWGLLGRAVAVVVPLWILYMIISAVAVPEVAATDAAPGSGFTAESVLMLIIMLLTTPLQAAGEEYGARGLIMRAAGSWVASPLPGLVIATLVPSFVFMLAHGAGDPWLNAYYFLFGAAMSLLVWRTGGLEMNSVVHIVNNMMAFGIVILAGQEINLDRSAGTGGAFMLFPMAVLVIVTIVLSVLAKRWGVARTYRLTGSLPATGNDTH